jgi:hypothetical protein
MRLCLLGLAAIALAQPASAHEHRHHRHPAHHHRSHHSHHLRLAPDLDTAALPLVTAPVRMRAHREAQDSAYEAMIARHAQANGLPVELVRHVVKKESNFNPRAHNRGALGLMQITHATARGAGYTGSAEGLYDPETNLTYAVRYLAGAYRAAGGNQSRAWALYRSGYYRRGDSTPVRTVSFTAPDAAPKTVAVKEIVVREVAVKHDVAKDQARVVAAPEQPVVERKPRIVTARLVAEPEVPATVHRRTRVAVARVVADEEPRVRLRHHSRHSRRAHEAESGVLDAFLKLAVRGSIQPKHRGPLARAD